MNKRRLPKALLEQQGEVKRLQQAADARAEFSLDHEEAESSADGIIAELSQEIVTLKQRLDDAGRATAANSRLNVQAGKETVMAVPHNDDFAERRAQLLAELDAFTPTEQST